MESIFYLHKHQLPLLVQNSGPIGKCMQGLYTEFKSLIMNSSPGLCSFPNQSNRYFPNWRSRKQNQFKCLYFYPHLLCVSLQTSSHAFYSSRLFLFRPFEHESKVYTILPAHCDFQHFPPKRYYCYNVLDSYFKTPVLSHQPLLQLQTKRYNVRFCYINSVYNANKKKLLKCQQRQQ